MKKNIFILFFFIFFSALSSFSQETAEDTQIINQSQKKLQTIRKNITDQVKREREVQGQKRKILHEIEEIENKIRLVTEEIINLKPLITTNELEYLTTLEEIKKNTINLDILKENIEGRLRAYQGLTTIGIFNIFFSSKTFTELFTRNIYLKYILEHDAYIKKVYKENLIELSKKRLELEKKRAVLEERKGELLQLQKKLDESRLEKENYWEKLTEAEEEFKMMINELRASAAQLEQNLKKYKTEQVNIPKLDIRETNVIFEGDPNDFISRKGKLVSPVFGILIAKNPIRDSKGIIIETKEGSEIRSPAMGRVYYMGNHPGYGNLIIIDHGGGYRTLIAQGLKFFVELGQNLEEGELIGFSAGGAWIKEGVYIEIQKDNKAINTKEWFDLRGIKVK